MDFEIHYFPYDSICRINWREGGLICIVFKLSRSAYMRSLFFIGPRPRFIADVVYLMDSSSSVGATNYRWQKNFVKAIARGLNHGDQATRACLVIYSNVARLITTFDSHKTLTQFERAVDGAPYLRRTRRVDKALEYAANLLRRARKGVPKVTVLITSGPRASSNSLDVPSKQLTDVDAKSFVVAIGNTLNIRELRAVVSNSDDIFRVPAFLLLPRITESFSKHIISSFGKEAFLLW